MRKSSFDVQGSLRALKRWWQAHRVRQREREQLARLSDFDFADMGTTRAQLEFELESPLMRKLREWSF